MTKPTILFVPGAWHTPAHYQSFFQKLQDAGYPTNSKQLPSVGATEPETQTSAADAAFIRGNVLLPDIEQGKDVILVMHSYGGCPGAAAAKGLSKAERTAVGKTGGIVGLVFMCAFVANEGDSLRSKLPGNKLDPWNILNVCVPQEPENPSTDTTHRKRLVKSQSTSPKRSSTTELIAPSPTLPSRD
jgi:pimeloyl-ACP methyl ester carboxylesterase